MKRYLGLRAKFCRSEAQGGNTKSLNLEFQMKHGHVSFVSFEQLDRDIILCSGEVGKDARCEYGATKAYDSSSSFFNMVR